MTELLSCRSCHPDELFTEVSPHVVFCFVALPVPGVAVAFAIEIQVAPRDEVLIQMHRANMPYIHERAAVVRR